MVTTVGTKTKSAKTVQRLYLLRVQIRNLLARTTDTSQDTLTKIDTALIRQWIQTIGVYGLDASGQSHVGLELTINWATHTVQVRVAGEEVTIEQAVYIDDLAPEVTNGIVVFNQAVNAECLRSEWRMTHPKGVDAEHVRRELGFVACSPLLWAGNVEKQVYPVPELPELTMTFLEAIPDAPLGLFDQIKDVFR
jgi:hypothetical protein